MYADIFILLFLLVTVITGYIGGGFREILKLVIFLAMFFVFSFSSVSNFILKISSQSLYPFVASGLFFLSYFVFFKLFFWVLKPLITIKEGFLGKFNIFFGIIAGFLKGVIVLFFMTFLISYSWQRHFLTELKPILTHSYIFMFLSSFF